MQDYAKLWVYYIDYFEPLDDDELGRLTRAMLQYIFNGTTPDLLGNERYLWPIVKLDIDRMGDDNE